MDANHHNHHNHHHRSGANVTVNDPMVLREQTLVREARAFPSRRTADDLSKSKRSTEESMVLTLLASNANKLSRAAINGDTHMDIFVPHAHAGLPSFDHAKVMARLVRELHMLGYDIEYVYDAHGNRAADSMRVRWGTTATASSSRPAKPVRPPAPKARPRAAAAMYAKRKR